MSDFYIGDPVRLIENADRVKELQKKANLDELHYETIKNLIGYVNSIRNKIRIEVNFIIDDQKRQFTIHGDALEQINVKTLSRKENPFPISIPSGDNRAPASTGDIDSQSTSSSVSRIIHPINKHLRPLSNAIKNNDVETLEKLCKKNSHINDSEAEKRQTLYHLASIQDNLKLMNVLRHARCNENAVDSDGDTIMNLAVYANKMENVEYIFKYYPKLTEVRNQRLETPFQTACHNKNIDIAIRLLNMNSSVINFSNWQMNAAIHYAASYDCAKLIRAILNIETVDLNVRNGKGMTAFHIACSKGIQSNVDAIVNYCRSKKCIGILDQLTSDNESGHQLAIRNSHIVIGQNIVDNEPMMWSNMISVKHGSILHSATKQKCLSLVKSILLFDGRIINIENSNGETALDIAEILHKKQLDQETSDVQCIVDYLKQEGGKNGV